MKSRIIPKSKTGGVVSSTILGVGGLIIGVIIVLVIVSTMFSANLFESDSDTATITNETVTIDDRTGGVSFGNYTFPGAACSVIDVVNITTGEPINVSNYTVTDCTIVTDDAGTLNNTAIFVSSTTTFEGGSESAARGMGTNFTAGIDNVSAKIPTILLIVAVVFLFGALVLLMRNAKQMGIGGGGSL